MASGENGGDQRLRLLIERIERLEEEKKGISEDIRDVFAEAKAVGYDTKIMKLVIKDRKLKPEERSERDSILETYKVALGMASGYSPQTEARAERLASETDEMKTEKGDAPVHMMSAEARADRKKAKVEAEDAQAAGDAEHEAKLAAMREELKGEPLDRARALVIEKQNGSCSWLQRQLGVSFRSASMLVDMLEHEGVLSEANLQGRRSVLKSKGDA